MGNKAVSLKLKRIYKRQREKNYAFVFHSSTHPVATSHILIVLSLEEETK